jgi:hypothetical protein
MTAFVDPAIRCPLRAVLLSSVDDIDDAEDSEAQSELS